MQLKKNLYINSLKMSLQNHHMNFDKLLYLLYDKLVITHL